MNLVFPVHFLCSYKKKTKNMKTSTQVHLNARLNQNALQVSEGLSGCCSKAGCGRCPPLQLAQGRLLCQTSVMKVPRGLRGSQDKTSCDWWLTGRFPWCQTHFGQINKQHSKFTSSIWVTANLICIRLSLFYLMSALSTRRIHDLTKQTHTKVHEITIWNT